MGSSCSSSVDVAATSKMKDSASPGIAADNETSFTCLLHADAQGEHTLGITSTSSLSHSTSRTTRRRRAGAIKSPSPPHEHRSPQSPLLAIHSNPVSGNNSSQNDAGGTSSRHSSYAVGSLFTIDSGPLGGNHPSAQNPRQDTSSSSSTAHDVQYQQQRLALRTLLQENNAEKRPSTEHPLLNVFPASGLTSGLASPRNNNDTIAQRSIEVPPSMIIDINMFQPRHMDGETTDGSHGGGNTESPKSLRSRALTPTDYNDISHRHTRPFRQEEINMLRANLAPYLSDTTTVQQFIVVPLSTDFGDA